MRKNTLSQIVTTLFTTGSLLIVSGAVLWLKIKDVSGWLVACGGFILAISLLISSSINKEENLSFRAKRLERMQLFSSLLYLVAGGFMIQRSGSWLPIFAVGTIFFVYSAFAKDKKSSK